MYTQSSQFPQCVLSSAYAPDCTFALQASKRLRAISFSKHLWILVLRDLSERGLVGPLSPPGENWNDFASADLINEIKRSVAGPSTWSPDSLIPPTVHRRVFLPFGRTGSLNHFLPCGRYIVRYIQDSFLRHERVECWSVQAARKVWSWQCPNHIVETAAFDFRDKSEALACVMYSQNGYASLPILCTM